MYFIIFICIFNSILCFKSYTLFSSLNVSGVMIDLCQCALSSTMVCSWLLQHRNHSAEAMEDFSSEQKLQYRARIYQASKNYSQEHC